GHEVVLTGDFNLDPNEVAPTLEDAGLRLAGGNGIDMIWVSEAADTNQSHDLDTAGTSNHNRAPTVTLE
ncbi:MAG: hypothetical protein KC416_07700, partial [Myxococcales bacterium]|nr:hypothetical protein [Myxococcales bacterium]